MQLNQDLLAAYSQLSLSELSQLRKALDANEARLLVKLLDAQAQLAAVTEELVSRYQAEPQLALAALPKT